MGFANFSSKSALAAASLLRQLDASAFERRLSQETVGVAFDFTATTCWESHATLELLIDLLARLYPRIILLPPAQSGDAELALIGALCSRAQQINPEITLLVDDGDAPSVVVIVGSSTYEGPAPAVYVGSRGWWAGMS